MKKLLAILLLLTLCLAVFAGCKKDEEEENQNNQPSAAEELEKKWANYTYDDFARDAQGRAASKITTFVNYTIGDESLNGHYVTYLGQDVVTFSYSYERYATVEEAADSRIVTATGTAYYRNGMIAVAEGDSEPSEWTPVSPSGIDVGIALAAGKKYATLNESKSVATMNLTSAQAIEVLGTDFDAQGNILLTITVTNSYLNNVKIAYVTEGGATVTVETSYTYATGAADDISIEAAVANVAALCRVSQPSKVDVQVQQTSGTLTLNSNAVLKIGTINGKKAATYVKVADRLGDINAESAIVEETTSFDYIEGKGTRLNGGEWNPNGQSFIPTSGYLKFDLSQVRNVTYDKNTSTLSFVIDRANVAQALGSLLNGNNIAADVTVSISNSAGVISAIDLSYQLEYAADGGTVNKNPVAVSLHAAFSYDLEEITID